MSDLREALQDIDGVGEARADEIMELVEAHDSGGVDDDVRDALDYLDAGRPGYAAKYLRRVVDGGE